ncbi:MAG: hypothetical protein UU47_C0002G0053 [candidate division TM6 bacterium GW2011_GWE2_41_16]|nr:MAG: hypothetical protein UU47_C0002G0053 [candidate division TM6 bacterium GW2011_GWE2_41_16]
MKKVIKIFYIILFSNIFFSYSKNTVIVITGPSCAGKTSISNIFQKHFCTEQWLTISMTNSYRIQYLLLMAKMFHFVAEDFVTQNGIVLDQAVRTYLSKLDHEDERKKKTQLWESFRDEGERIFIRFLEMLLIEGNKKIVVDIPVFKKCTLDLLKESLKNEDVIFVLVHTSFKDTIGRVYQRNKILNSVDSSEYRYANQVICRYFSYYFSIPQKDDATVETFSLQSLHDLIVSKDVDAECLPQMPMDKELFQYIISQIHIFDQKNIYLKPRLHYDCVINTSVMSSYDAALVIRSVSKKQHAQSNLFANE